MLGVALVTVYPPGSWTPLLLEAESMANARLIFGAANVPRNVSARSIERLVSTVTLELVALSVHWLFWSGAPVPRIEGPNQDVPASFRSSAACTEGTTSMRHAFV